MLKRRIAAGFTLIELMIVVAIIGILAAIAIPNFIKFQAKSKQSEAKTNLKGIFTAQKSFYGEHDAYGTQFSVVGFAPEKGNRYNYSMGTDNIPQDLVRFPTAVAGPNGTWPTTTGGGASTTGPGVSSGCPACVFEAGAYGNVDTDSNVDTWSISSDTATGTVSTCAPTMTAPGGVPLLVYDDVAC